MNEILTLVGDGVLAAEDVDPLLTEGFALRWSVIGPSRWTTKSVEPWVCCDRPAC
jgi:3-hydroxyacyl-CoA dehydrogenase